MDWFLYDRGFRHERVKSQRSRQYNTVNRYSPTVSVDDLMVILSVPLYLQINLGKFVLFLIV